MYSIQAVTLFFALVSVCDSQQSGPVRSPFPSISGFHNTTSVPVSTFISITPTPVSSSVAPTSSAPATVTVSNGETVAVAAGVVVVGAGIGGFFTVNGVTTPIAGGASVVAGSSAANPGDPSNPDDPDKPKSNDGDIATNSAPASVPASSAPPMSATSSDIPFSSTSSSAAPTGTSVDYMIFAKENTVKEDADGFGNTLAGLVGADNIDTIVNDAGIPYVWRANLTPDQHEKVKNDRVIAGTDINDPLTRDDDTLAGAQPSATQQKRAEVTQIPIAKNDIFDLRVLSTPPREKEALPNYRYDDFAGQGITIYVVDTGPFDLQHEEFKAPSPDITRRELNVARNKKFTLEDTQHGTCVASKTVGETTGAAKRANLVGVRIDFTEFGLLRGLQSAANEIKQKGLKGKAVVTTSILMRAPDAMYTISFRSAMRSLKTLDVPVVAAAGNKFLDGLTEPDKLPATMANEFPVIVVGNAGRDFKIAPKSQRGNLVTTYAIGADIKCADPLDLTGLATDSGTSFAAPQVAGMVAYWMSHPEFAGDLAPGKVAETLRNMTGALSYPRVAETGYPPIAWNGHDLAESCSIPSSGTGRRAKRAMRRDLGQACSYAPTSVASAAPTASAPAGNAPPSGSDVPTATTTSVTETATAGPTTCNLCGAMLDSGNAGNLGGQVGCDGAEYARSSCEANADCKSWAYGNEDRGTYTIPVCLLFTESATQIVSQAPPDPEGKCPFRYHDKACPVP
ncbi:subtilisin-like protease [Colletotrichum asianum]